MALFSSSLCLWESTIFIILKSGTSFDVEVEDFFTIDDDDDSPYDEGELCLRYLTLLHSNVVGVVVAFTTSETKYSILIKIYLFIKNADDRVKN